MKCDGLIIEIRSARTFFACESPVIIGRIQIHEDSRILAFNMPGTIMASGKKRPHAARLVKGKDRRDERRGYERRVASPSLMARMQDQGILFPPGSHKKPDGFGPKPGHIRWMKKKSVKETGNSFYTSLHGGKHALMITVIEYRNYAKLIQYRLNIFRPMTQNNKNVKNACGSVKGNDYFQNRPVTDRQKRLESTHAGRTTGSQDQRGNPFRFHFLISFKTMVFRSSRAHNACAHILAPSLIQIVCDNSILNKRKT